MKTILTAVALFAFAAPGTSDDPLAALPTTPIDIEVRDAPADDIYALMAEVTGTTFDVEPCRPQTLSLKLEAAPPAVLLRVMGSRLGRSYSWTADHLVVHCEPETEPEPELDISIDDAPADRALQLIADIAEQPLQIEGCTDERVDLTATHVPAGAALEAMFVQLGATVQYIDGVAHVRC
ncbi:MAG: hypothetical protein K0V04_01735 [Deltaproteobacteria bacterium]|nr:hypothetical protein [Deltaproteobacteria bacterium]